MVPDYLPVDYVRKEKNSDSINDSTPSYKQKMKYSFIECQIVEFCCLYRKAKTPIVNKQTSDHTGEGVTE